MSDLAKFQGIYDFRQGTTGRLEVIFLNYLGEVIPQTALPTVEVLYINERGHPATAVEVTIMNELESGRYYYDWFIPLDHPTVEHQIHYVGEIDGFKVVGEDIVTVLPRETNLCCVYLPTVIQGGCHRTCDC